MNPEKLLHLVKEAQVRFRDVTSVAEAERVAPETGAALARMIDHTLLKADATEVDLRKLCAEARAHHFATVCVNSSRVGLARSELAGSKTHPIAVVGFPLGACTTKTKVFETAQAIESGAKEIDMVIAIGALKDGNLQTVYDDIRAVVLASQGTPVKVILETTLLNREEKIAACILAREAGAQFVKTSTGFSTGGATVEDVRLMRAIVGDSMGVKASGGIRTREDAIRMIRAGANRIGASASVSIVTDIPAKNPAAAGTY